RQPPLQRRAVQIAEPLEPALRGDPPQLAGTFRPVLRAGAHVLGERLGLVLRHRGLRRRPGVRPEAPRPPPQLGPHPAAAAPSLQPVGTTRTAPAPSRYLAYHLPDRMTMRSCPASPVVNGAVRRLPLASFHRTNRPPLRTKGSAPGGTGLVTVFRNTVP